MKKALFLLIGLLALCVQNPAHAFEEGFYISGFGGVDFLNVKKHDGVRLDFKTGVDAGIDLGYRWCGGLRLEGEFAYYYNKASKIKVTRPGTTDIAVHVGGHYRTWALMANVLYDIPLCWCATPYVGAGIGYAHQKLKLNKCSNYVEGAKKGFAWQLIGGLSYPIDYNWDLAVEYRYFRGEAKHVNNQDINLKISYYW